MSQNKAVHNIGAEQIMATKKGQGRHHKAYFRGRHRTVMLDDRVDVLTLTNSGDLSWTDEDVSDKIVDGGTGDISDDTVHLILLVSMRDSGSAATNTYMSFRKNGASSTDGVAIVKGYHINNEYNQQQIIVPVDDDYIFEYKVEASGGSTLDATVSIVGYIEQIS